LPAAGDATTLFGVVFLATSIALFFGSSLIPVSIYAFFAAIDAIVVGVRIWWLQITQEPLVSAVGFVLAGLLDLGVFPFLMWFRENNVVRWIGILLLLATALIWAVTFYGSLWAHLSSFSKWVPVTMGK
jgi:putative membrane protein